MTLPKNLGVYMTVGLHTLGARYALVTFAPGWDQEGGNTSAKIISQFFLNDNCY